MDDSWNEHYDFSNTSPALNFDDPFPEGIFDEFPLDELPGFKDSPPRLQEQTVDPTNLSHTLEADVRYLTQQQQYVEPEEINTFPRQSALRGFVTLDGVDYWVDDKGQYHNYCVDENGKCRILTNNSPGPGFPQEVQAPTLGYMSTLAPSRLVAYPQQPLVPDYQPTYYPSPSMNSGVQALYVPQHPTQTLAAPQILPQETLRASLSSSRIPSISRENGSVPSQFPPSPESLPSLTPSPKRPVKNHNGELLRNDTIPRRTRHLKKAEAPVEPEQFYGPSPPKPKPWGPKDARGEYQFTYTEKGELMAGKFFTRLQMRQYLLGPSSDETWEGPTRCKGVKRRPKLRRQGLTLWIGWPASMANDRYPRGGESTKCRFKDCKFEHHTIKNGTPWVIFDERHNKDGEYINPFHNAGYCHLYCLEESFDIVELSMHVNVRPDNRKFKREDYDYFNLSTKMPGIHEVFRRWWQCTIHAWRDARTRGQRRKRTPQTSLHMALVDYKLTQEPKAQHKTRQRRGGLDMEKHHNDPEVIKKLRTFKKHGLLDSSGHPLPDAELRLEEIENAKMHRRKRSRANDYSPAYTPVHQMALPPLDFNQMFYTPNQQQVLPATPKQFVTTHPQEFMPVHQELFANTTQYGQDTNGGIQPVPMFTEPVWSETGNPYTTNYGGPVGYPTFNMDGTYAPSAPVETRGHKRTRDEDPEDEPSPKTKRARVDEQPDPTAPTQHKSPRADNRVSFPTCDNTIYEPGMEYNNLEADNGATFNDNYVGVPLLEAKDIDDFFREYQHEFGDTLVDDDANNNWSTNIDTAGPETKPSSPVKEEPVDEAVLLPLYSVPTNAQLPTAPTTPTAHVEEGQQQQQQQPVDDFDDLFASPVRGQVPTAPATPMAHVKEEQQQPVDDLDDLFGSPVRGQVPTPPVSLPASPAAIIVKEEEL